MITYRDLKKSAEYNAAKLNEIRTLQEEADFRDKLFMYGFSFVAVFAVIGILYVVNYK